jgi:hypothetical protein
MIIQRNVMEQFEKQIYDILVKAEWLENVTATESELQKGVHERVLKYREGATLLDNGQYKLWMFSKLYRELLKGGLATPADMNVLIQMGMGAGIQQGWEKFPTQ